MIRLPSRTFHRLIILTFLFASFPSCQSDDSPEPAIIGVWKLIREESYAQNGKSIIDFSSYNITYKFNTNGTVDISGGESINYHSGTFNYTFEEFDPNNIKPYTISNNVVRIDVMEYFHTYQNGEMTLGQAHIDGANMIFVRE